MGYKLVPYNGDTVAVPQLVFTHLAQAGWRHDPRGAVHFADRRHRPPHDGSGAGAASIEAAKRALQYWAGAGLLENERSGSPPGGRAASRRFGQHGKRPYVAVLSQESQTIFGKGISRNELQRLVDLYQIDGWKPDVILLFAPRSPAWDGAPWAR